MTTLKERLEQKLLAIDEYNKDIERAAKIVEDMPAPRVLLESCLEMLGRWSFMPIRRISRPSILDVIFIKNLSSKNTIRSRLAAARWVRRHAMPSPRSRNGLDWRLAHEMRVRKRALSDVDDREDASNEALHVQRPRAQTIQMRDLR